MRTIVSIPDGHLDAADRLAEYLGITRNELFRKAIELFLEQCSPERETVSARKDYFETEDF